MRERQQPELNEGLGQVLPRHRLLHDRRGAEREALVAIGDDRDDDDRDALSAGICLMRPRNSQPSISGSMMSRVISDSGCCTASTSAASADAACSTAKPSRLQLQAHQLGGLEVVFDHQRSARARRRRRRARQRRRSRTSAGVARPAARSGSQTVKHEPSPTALSTATAPPCSSASSFTIASPRPVPSNFRARPLSIWLNGLNSCARSSGEMPMPVSVDADFEKLLELAVGQREAPAGPRARQAADVGARRRGARAGSPGRLRRVNFTAFESRL